MSQPKNRNRNFRDVSRLTPYEEKIWALHCEGLHPKEIAERIGTKSSSTIISRLRDIREKMDLKNENRKGQQIHRQSLSLA